MRAREEELLKDDLRKMGEDELCGGETKRLSTDKKYNSTRLVVILVTSLCRELQLISSFDSRTNAPRLDCADLTCSINKKGKFTIFDLTYDFM